MTTTRVAPQWTLGDRLAKARRWAGVSVEEMATDLGRSARTIRNYEHDASGVPLNILRRYAARTSVPLVWLIGEDDEAPPGGETPSTMQVTACYPVWAPYRGEDAA